MFGRPGAEAFDEDGQFKEEALRHRMEMVCKTLIERAAMMLDEGRAVTKRRKAACRIG